jgi:hypothetical protein
MHQTVDVFGVRSRLIKTYLERDAVDVKFKEALDSGNEVIVYGSSKQGKTSLILKHLSEEQYVKVECSPNTQPVDIYKSILRQIGVTFIEFETTDEGYEQGAKVGGSFRVKIPFIGDTKAGVDAQGKATNQSSVKESHVEYNLALAQDVSEVLHSNGFTKYVVLENFHYLSHEVQQSLAYDLRIFQDHHLVFVVLGIWREANRLVQFNGDLLDRVTEVAVEPWDRDDFFRVISTGENLLNIDFSDVKEKLVDESFDSIGVVQEICKLCCQLAGVNSTSPNKVSITRQHLSEAMAAKANEYGVRHIRNFESFVDVRVRVSAQSGKPSLAYPYYFIKLLLSEDFEDIQRGMARGYLLDAIRKVHHRPDDVRSSDLGQFLHNLTQHQIGKGIQPPFVDYDRGGKVLKIIDSSLYFFLKHCDREEILGDIPNPIEEI